MKIESDEADLRIERCGDQLHATLNRVDRRNALTTSMIESLGNLSQQLAEDDVTRVLILRGAGGIFCVGGDITGFKNVPADIHSIAAQNRRFGALLARLNRLSQTVIAVVEGFAFGGGIGLVCIADIVIAAQDAQFAVAEATLGVPPAQIAPFLIERLGLSRARWLALTGRRIGAQEARALGLVHQVGQSREELDALLQAELRLVNRCAPQARAATKELLLAVGTLSQEAFLDRAAVTFAERLTSAEGREGAESFLAKRTPAWVGPDT